MCSGLLWFWFRLRHSPIRGAWLPTPSPQGTALPSHWPLQKPAPLCLLGPRDSWTSSRAPLTPDFPSDSEAPAPQGGGWRKERLLSCKYHCRTRAWESAWLGGLQDVDRGGPDVCVEEMEGLEDKGMGVTDPRDPREHSLSLDE